MRPYTLKEFKRERKRLKGDPKTYKYQHYLAQCKTCHRRQMKKKPQKPVAKRIKLAHQRKQQRAHQAELAATTLERYLGKRISNSRVYGATIYKPGGKKTTLRAPRLSAATKKVQQKAAYLRQGKAVKLVLWREDVYTKSGKQTVKIVPLQRKGAKRRRVSLILPRK